VNAYGPALDALLERLKDSPPDGTRERLRELADIYRSMAAVHDWKADEMEKETT
jgi:hypothetical protein